MASQRKSLREQIEGLEFEDDEVIFNLMQEIDEEEIAATGFRWAAPSTQKHQDRVLANYRAFVKVTLPKGSDEDKVEEECFPHDPAKYERMYKRFKAFLIFVDARTPPRRREQQSVGYNVLSKARDALIFWTKHIYAGRQDFAPIQIPNISRVYNKCTEAMQYAARKRRIGTQGTQPRSMPVLNPSEIQQLIDYDLATTPCIDLAECHHLAWCLARICALRPGSLGQQRQSNMDHTTIEPNFLTFGDIEITRGMEAGAFNAKITIRIHKTSYPNQPERQNTTGASSQHLVFNTRSPLSGRNLIFSVPHRLLIVGLRRKALADIDSLDQLLDGSTRYISWKPEFKAQPVFLAGGPRGISVIPGTPCNSESFTEYLARRTLYTGYGLGISFYDLRRGAAQDWVRLFGADAAREMMGHAPDTRTLEQFYVELRSSRDVTGAALGETVDTGSTGRRAGLELQQLTPEVLKNMFGHVINAQFRNMIAADTTRSFTSAKDLQNYERRMRRAALRVVMEAAQEELRHTMTVEDYRNRQMNRNAISHFMQMITQTAREKMSRQDQQDPFLDNADFDEDFMEHPRSFDPEPDVEDTEVAPGSSIFIDTVNDNDGLNDVLEGFSEEVPFRMMVETFMESMLQNTYSQFQYSKDLEQTCILCETDDTVDADAKIRIYPHSQLQRHLRSKFHSPRDKFLRRCRLNAHTNNYFSCPYCDELAADAHASPPQFASEKRLLEHIHGSSASRAYLRSGLPRWLSNRDVAAKHDSMKEMEGWYADDWKGDLQHRAAVGRVETRSRRQKLEEYIEYSRVKELEDPIPAKWPFLQHGYDPGALAASLEPDVAAGFLSYTRPIEGVSTAAIIESSNGVLRPTQLPSYGNQDSFESALQASLDKDIRRGLLKRVPLDEARMRAS